MTYTHLLHDLIGMVGANVIVTANITESAHRVLACAGVMRGAVDVLDAAATDHECLYFPISDYADTGFMITRSEFTDAKWDGTSLRVTLGSIVLTVTEEREEGDT